MFQWMLDSSLAYDEQIDTFQVANTLMKALWSRGENASLCALPSDTNTEDRHVRWSRSAQWRSCTQRCRAVDAAPQPHGVSLAVSHDPCLQAETDRLLQPREHLSSQCMPPAAFAPRLPANTRRNRRARVSIGKSVSLLVHTLGQQTSGGRAPLPCDGRIALLRYPRLLCWWCA